MPLGRVLRSNLAAVTSEGSSRLSRYCLRTESAGVSRESAVATHHSVTGKDDAQRIPADELAHLLGWSCRRPRKAANSPVGDGLAVSNGVEQLPHPALLCGAASACPLEDRSRCVDPPGSRSTGSCAAPRTPCSPPRLAHRAPLGRGGTCVRRSRGRSALLSSATRVSSPRSSDAELITFMG